MPKPARRSAAASCSTVARISCGGPPPSAPGAQSTTSTCPPVRNSRKASRYVAWGSASSWCRLIIRTRSAIPSGRGTTVSFPSSYPVGGIVIDTKGRQLFLVQSPTEALRYPISVGREGFSWTGAETISRKAEWPDWHPPGEMRWRDPRLPEKMTGGIKNPLGAMALYLGSSLYRIHGTNDATSIGRAASSGCFRMLNGHVVDLAARVDVGTGVQVVHRLPPELEKVVADQVAPPSPAPGPRKPVVTRR